MNIEGFNPENLLAGSLNFEKYSPKN
jgi:hypothetical protein